MLTQCSECQLQISDKAITCPHCGYPLKPDVVRTRSYTSRKKRLPNGFGQISRINNKKLRNPYRAMVTVGKNPDTGRPISRLLKPNAYFATYNEAYAALLEYNKKPYDLESKSLTLYQVYEEWKPNYFKDLSENTIVVHEAAWLRCDMLQGMKISEIRSRHIRACLDECEKDSIKKRIKSLLNAIFDYAVENEYTDKNYARETKYKIDTTVKNEHHAFSDEIMKKLWDNVYSEKYLDMVLIQCYTGFRPQELVSIKLEDVDLNNWTLTGGMKTEAGKNRVVPIHEKIKGLVKTKYRVATELGSEYLFNSPMWNDPENVELMKITYRRYNWIFTQAMNIIGEEGYKPHDPRKTFVTLGKKYGMNDYAIKRIVGHAITDITEGVYTERDIEWLRDEINKIESE